MAASAPSVAWLGGRLVPYGEATLPIEDRGLTFGESLYEVVALTAGQLRLLHEHAARMRHGAEFIGIARGVPSDSEWDSIGASLLAADPIREGMLYAQVTGGAAPRLHVPPHEAPGTFFAFLRALSLPRHDTARRGIRAILLQDLRWGRCDVKTTLLLPAVLAKRQAAARGAGEALLFDESGAVQEGASSNLFLVEDGALVTPPQSEHLLPGLTRELVVRLAERSGIPVRREVIARDRLFAAGEVFVTSTTQLVMPVTHVDGRPIGAGEAGAVSLELARALRREYELE